jgi:hypothetical protein
MKNLRLVIGIVVILAVVCSPALAISMSDLISQHQGQSTILCLFERHRALNVYESDVFLVNERLNVYADRREWRLYFNPVIVTERPVWRWYEGPAIEYEPGMVR